MPVSVGGPGIGGERALLGAQQAALGAQEHQRPFSTERPQVTDGGRALFCEPQSPVACGGPSLSLMQGLCLCLLM